jgi:copper chaperone CopZ|tara:strand:+ start:3082 stop:3435 length:354 start_codon:yes stop_codon:yes gene_type:complete
MNKSCTFNIVYGIICLVFSWILITTLQAKEESFNPDVELKIIGLVCPSCAIGIKNGFLKTKLIKRLKFDSKKQTCRIEFIFIQIHPDKMKKIVKDAGYELTSVKYLKDRKPKRYNQP